MTPRLLLRRRNDSADAALPPPSLSPDAWIASLIAAVPDIDAPTGDQHDGAKPPAVSGNGSHPRARSRFWPGWRSVGRVGVVLVLAASIGFAGVAVVGRSNALRELAATRAADRARIANLEAGLAAAEKDATAANAGGGVAVQGGTKSRVVKTKWIPDGKGITVELTGYEGVLEIHDVHLTHAYGFSDLLGIAVNNSGDELPYVQLGCSLLDAKGRVLANVIDNRESWPAGASWGFDCSAEVNATGGIVRVDAAG